MYFHRIKDPQNPHNLHDPHSAYDPHDPHPKMHSLSAPELPPVLNLIQVYSSYAAALACMLLKSSHFVTSFVWVQISVNETTYESVEQLHKKIIQCGILNKTG